MNNESVEVIELSHFLLSNDRFYIASHPMIDYIWKEIVTSIRIILVTFVQTSINLSFFASIKE